MTKETTNKVTATVNHTDKSSVTRWSVIRPALETAWWLWLAVDANFITGSKAA